MSGLIGSDKKRSGVISLDAQYTNDVDRVDVLEIFRHNASESITYTSSGFSTVLRLGPDLNTIFNFKYGNILPSQEISKYQVIISGSSSDSSYGGLQFLDYSQSTVYAGEYIWGNWWSGPDYQMTDKYEITGSTNFPLSRTIQIRRKSGSGTVYFQALVVTRHIKSKKGLS